MRRYLNKLAAAGTIDLLVNETNLGFVGAINRALERVSTGDVVLLNSDTIVPPGFVERLATMARSAPNIGTVTPLSNNGDIFSFPTPNDVNPMQSYEQILGIDRVASTANAGDAIDVPSGIGFCLYITRDCLAPLAGSRKILNEAISRMSISACAHAPRVFATSARRRSMSDITARNPFSTRSEAWCFAIWTFWTGDSRTTGGNVARSRSPIHYDRRARGSIAR